MKLNTMLGCVGLAGGLLINSGCITGPKGLVSTYIDEQHLQRITNNKLINCSNIKVSLSFLDATTQYPVRFITDRGSHCKIYFDSSQVNANDIKTRGYTLYIYQDNECIATLYKAPHTKPFFSSTC